MDSLIKNNFYIKKSLRGSRFYTFIKLTKLNANLNQLRGKWFLQTTSNKLEINLTPARSLLVVARHNGGGNTTIAIATEYDEGDGRVIELYANSNFAFSVSAGVLSITSTAPYWGYNAIEF